MLAGDFARLGVQAVYFLLVAAALDSSGYGSFASVLALVAILAQFSGWGWGTILIKQTSRDPSAYRSFLGQALQVTMVSGALLTIVAVSISWALFREAIPITLPIYVACADLLFMRMSHLAGQAFQAQDRLDRTAGVHLVLSGARLLGALGMTAFDRNPSPAEWALLYCVCSVAAAGISMTWAVRSFGAPVFSRRVTRREIAEGFHYSIGQASYTIYNDIDKTLLGRLATFSAAGVYSVGYRVIDMAFSPIRSIAFAAHSRFFAKGTAGVQATSSFAKRLALLGTVYALPASAGLFLLAPFVASLFGSSYEDTASVVRWLAIIPVCRTIQYFFSEALTGAGYQEWRSRLQIIVAMINVAMNLVLIPIWSWRGAAVTSIACDVTLAVGMWWLVSRAQSREDSAQRAMAPAT